MPVAIGARDRLACMKKLTVALGTSTLLFALTDLIHGQHNGDVHRFYIHLAEFASFLGFISLLEIQAFRLSLFEIEASRLTAEKTGLSRWLAGLGISFASSLLGFILFGLSGGSAHGDGGPLAAVFILMGCIGTIGIPICLIGSFVAIIKRKRNESSVP